ncbi:MAG: hypothetical protein ACTSRE_11595 [Promethearchaeota archaeon]
MSNIPKYKISPSDSNDWFIIELAEKKIKIDVEKSVLTTRYDCIPHPVQIKDSDNCVSCSNFCCYMGCYVSPLEIKFIEEILPQLKPYLTKDSRKVLKKFHDEFYLPEDYDPKEKLYKTRCSPEETTRFYFDEDVDEEEIDADEDEIIEIIEDSDVDSNSVNLEDNISEVPDSVCLFLMEGGLCALHKYCDDAGLYWPIDKFNICTTFPIDIRVTQNDTAKDAPYPLEKRVEDECSTLKMMDDYDDFLYTKMNCINLSPKIKAKKNVPYIIDSMKYAIVSRFGEEMWKALHDYAKKLQKSS